MNGRKLFLMSENPCSGIAAEALEYISKVGANTTLKNRILDFYKVLCENKIYSELRMMYPMIGDNSDKIKIDAVSKNKGAYDLTYVGEEGLDFSKGIKGDGVGYANTNYHENTHASETNCVHLIINDDVRQDNNDSYLYGARNGVDNNLYTALYDSGQMNTVIGNSSETVRYTTNNRLGVWTFRRIDSKNALSEGKKNVMEIYHNGEIVHTEEHYYTIQPPHIDYLLLSASLNGATSRATKNGLGFFALSKNLRPLKIQKLHEELTDLQTFLGRKTW